MPHYGSDETTSSPLATTSRRRLLQAAGLATLAGAATSQRPMAAQQATPIPVTEITLASSHTLLSISPQHGTRTASSHTTISFRGEGFRHLGMLSVEGSVSGVHSGILVPHPDGRGASWIPDDWFEPGEYVSVTAAIPLRPGGEDRLRFRIAEQAPRVEVTSQDTADAGAPDERFRSYVTRPDITPPVISVTTPPEGTAEGHILITPSLPNGSNGRAIIDEWGEPVLFDGPGHPDHANLCLKLLEYQGQPVLVWWEGAKTLGYGFGHWVIVNTSYEVIARVQAGNGISGLDCHDLVITPQGTAISIAYNPIRWNLAFVGGDAAANIADGVIQEIDIETGMVLWEWHSLDHIAPAESYFPIPGDADVPWDYIHFNSVTFDTDGNLLLSARHTHAAYKIDRQTGDVIWRLNGKRSDFVMGLGTWFAWAHDVQRQPDGTISLFDNHESDQERGAVAHSRGLFLALDEESMTATLAREIVHETGILSVSQANMQRLENGNMFIGWGSAPVFSEFDETDTMVYNGRFPNAVQSYRAYRHVWSGYPASPPDVVALPGEIRGMSVFASWNGATEVAEWRVLGGPAPDQMLEIARVPREGFETRIEIADTADWVEVEARDASGQPLGSSEPTALRR